MKTLSKERLNELKTLVGQWAENNFKVHAPAIGILEEIGEAAHCILKRKQGIRGFDDEEFFKKELKDAIADTAIYCFHEAYLKTVDLYISDIIHGDEGSEDENLLCALASNASCVLSGMSDHVNEVLDYAFGLAEHYGIDFAEAVEETWAKVSQRDWKKNPTDAHAQEVIPLTGFGPLLDSEGNPLKIPSEIIAAHNLRNESIELNAEQSLKFAEALTSEPREIPPALKKMRDEIEGEREKSFDRDQA